MQHIQKVLIIAVIINQCCVKYTAAENENVTSNIFCSGKLLHYVQMSRIFNDSKYFVDMKLKFLPQIVVEKFDELLNKTKNHPENSKLREFVNTNFEPPGAGIKKWIPRDWFENPKFLNNIYDYHLKTWARNLHNRWKRLGRVLSEDIQNNASLYSQIYVPNPYIIPGGRFRELYYWDSYWIIDGLIISEMYYTAQGMLNNFLHLVDKYGFVPNGGRCYYEERSQPPLLIPMMDLYWEAKNNYTFLLDSMDLLEKEFNFWLNNRSVEIIKYGMKYKVFQYRVNSSNPRPESYYEDVENSKGLNDTSRAQFFSEIKSAAESGWDFSSRWFLNNGTRTSKLIDIHITHLAPVCLNSIMAYNAKLLSKFFLIQKNKAKSDEYLDIAKNINKTISQLFYDDEEGMWFDYNIVLNKLQYGFYASNLMPLWADTYGVERDRGFVVDKAFSYLEKMNISLYPGGIPTSLKASTQQWDFPNGWAPLQYFVVLALERIKTTDKRASDLVYSFAEKWVLSCYKAYMNSVPHFMYEKYDVTQVGVPGKGGEYKDQEGFGWTNAVAIKFLSMYGHRLRTSNLSDPAPIIVSCILISTSVLAIINYIYRVRYVK